VSHIVACFYSRKVKYFKLQKLVLTAKNLIFYIKLLVNDVSVELIIYLTCFTRDFTAIVHLYKLSIVKKNSDTLYERSVDCFEDIKFTQPKFLFHKT